MRKFFAFISVLIILNLVGCRQNDNTNVNTNIRAEATMNNKVSLELPKNLEKFRDKFENSVKSYVKITAKKGKTLAWESKFGGTPYLPIGYEYPIDSNGEPMRLLAQINFEEMPGMEYYPTKGILQFYISPKDDLYGADLDKPTAQNNFKVIYIPEVIKDTSKIINDFSFVSSSEDDYFPIGAEGKLNYELDYVPVGIRDYQFEKIFNKTVYDFFDIKGDNEEEILEWEQSLDWYENKYSCAGHRIGGYAYFTQNDPREFANKDYDVLLLQIDSDDELDIMWGDVGIANFFIRLEDLMKMDFSKVLYNWDCC